MKDLYIFGAGVQGRVVADLVSWQFAGQYRVAGFFDDGKPAGEDIPSAGRVLGSVEEAENLLPRDAVAFVALGSRHRAKSLQLIRDLRDAGFSLARLVAPDARVSPSARLGENALVMPGAFLGCDVRAGDHVWLHANAAVEHHVEIGAGALFGPNASVASGSTIGPGSLVGVGASISNSISLGAGVLLGAGAVAVRNIPAGMIALGNPARPIRGTREGDEVITLVDLQGLGLLS